MRGRQVEAAENGQDSDVGKNVKPLELDDVLVNELGQFGWYQIRITFLVGLAMTTSAFFTEYVFSAAAIPHRCRIPECGEDSRDHEFEPNWILNTIPKSSSGFSSCERYVPVVGNGTLGYCPTHLFDTTRTVACDTFVYIRNNTIVYDFDLGCQEWLQALGGTLNSVGMLLALPIVGFLSDRYGRKMALVISVFNLAAVGLVRAFSVNHTMYLITQILQTTLASGVYSTAFIIVTETVGPKYRVFVCAIQPSMYSIGSAILGLVSWLVQPWRAMLVVLHVPCFLFISYYWILPESVRWLLVKHKYDDAREALQNVAKLNKTEISEKSLNALRKSYDKNPVVKKNSLIKRKLTLICGFSLCAACNIAFIFIPEEMSLVSLLTFLLGKWSISLVVPTVYLYTAELLPTECRHSLLGFCSTVGRLGGIVAPLTPALTQYWSGLPAAVFGAASLASALLVPGQPETLARPLPDTLEDAEALSSSTN